MQIELSTGIKYDAALDRRIMAGTLVKYVTYDEETKTFKDLPKLNGKNDFIIYKDGQVVKEETPVRKKAASKKTAKEEKKASHKKPQKNYDSYINIHIGEPMPEDPDAMLDNLAKSMSAYILKQKNEKFDLKAIHLTAEIVKETYALDVLKKIRIHLEMPLKM